MKVKIISDTHNEHYMLKSSDLECDILIHCGDAGTKGNYQEIRSFLSWFVKQPAKYKIFVPGNHDKSIKKNQDLQALCYEYGIELLMDCHTKINGKLIVGGTFVPFVRGGKYNQDIDVRLRAWSFLDQYEDIDILVTHAPPKHILDYNIKGEPCGCDMLYDKVMKTKPKYHVFGHIHEFGGKVVIGEHTTFINAACKDRDYMLVRGPMEFTI